jgi:hypothetical protein
VVVRQGAQRPGRLLEGTFRHTERLQHGTLGEPREGLARDLLDDELQEGAALVTTSYTLVRSELDRVWDTSA